MRPAVLRPLSFLPSGRGAPDGSALAVSRASPPSQSPRTAGAFLGSFGGVDFQRERLAPIVRELVPLIEADWREAGIDHADVPLVLDWTKYLDYDILGVLHIVTARDNGLLVGYVFTFIHSHIMHATTRWCIIDLYWLYPEYRGSGVGRSLMEAALSFLGDAGVKVVQASEKAAHPNGLFLKLGFTATDTVFRKIMERKSC
jgi:GNAT superfamily N-acetyltransferase